jgi:hypothetical protein
VLWMTAFGGTAIDQVFNDGDGEGERHRQL